MSVGWWRSSVGGGSSDWPVSLSTLSVTLAGGAVMAGTKPTGARPGGRV